MTTTAPTLDEVLTLARQLSPVEQARLMEYLLPALSDALSDALARTRPVVTEPPSPALRITELTEQLRTTPTSALARALAILPEGQPSPTDAEIARWRDERLTERYGV